MSKTDCNDVAERLDELLEEHVAGPGSDALRRHVAGCESCRLLVEQVSVLSRQARELPREIDPPRDLWPAIAAEIERSTVVRHGFAGRAVRHWRVAAMAAGVMVALVIAYQLGRHASAPQAVTAASWTETTGGLSGGSPDVVVQAGYREARDELLAALDLRRESLSDETLEIVDRNLAVIQLSIDRIQTALQEDPGNLKLARRLGFAYRQELDLLRRAMTIPTANELAGPARS